MPAQVTTNLDEARHELDANGYCVIPNVLVPEEMRTIRDRLWTYAAKAQQEGHFDPDARPVQNVGSLINRDPCFVDLVQHPVAMELVGHLLGDDFLLSSFGAKIALAQPAGDAPSIHLHHDQGYVPLPMPPYPVAAALMWCASDFTESNGGTLLVPASHTENTWPSADDLSRAVPVVAPAGSFALWDSRTWHATGHNASDEPRIGILGYYCRPWIRQQVNQLLDVSPEVLANASDRLKVLLGLKVHLTLGVVPPRPGNPSNVA